MLNREPTTRVVLSGTLDDLMDCLINHSDNGSCNFQDIFLTAFTEFTDPDTLFQKLSAEFHRAENSIQLNIISIITDWIMGDYLSPSQELLGRMRRFCQDVQDSSSSGSELEARAESLKNFILVETRNPHLAPTILLEVNSPLFNPPLAVCDPIDLAIGLTLLEGNGFRCFRAAVYIRHLQQHSSHDIIGRIRETNTRITAWVSKSILEDDRLDKRVDKMRYFIKTAVECQRLRNLSSTMAIARALGSAVVQNLRETRNGLSWNKQRKLSRLSKFADGDSDFACYRKALQKAHQQGTCIPWLTFHLDKLENISNHQSTYIEKDGQHLINFQRYNEIMDSFREVERYRQGPSYPLDQLHRISLDEIDALLRERSKRLEQDEAQLKNNRLAMVGLPS